MDPGRTEVTFSFPEVGCTFFDQEGSELFFAQEQIWDFHGIWCDLNVGSTTFRSGDLQQVKSLPLESPCALYKKADFTLLADGGRESVCWHQGVSTSQ